METRTIEQLEQHLRSGAVLGPDHDRLDAGRLEQIRRRGARRRRGRLAAILTAGLVVATTVAAVASLGGQDVARDRSPAASQEEPLELSDLAARALREVPGAVQVSDWQVVIPGPGTPASMEQRISPDEVVGATVPTDARVYLGPTIFDAGVFPDWLYRGVQRLEQTDLAGDDGSHPVGSTEPGILVDYGTAELGCVRWSDVPNEEPDAPCHLTLLARVGDGLFLRWGMGTERFLQPGAPMEVFLSPDYSTGRPTTLAIAGLDGTDVDRVEFVSADGTVTEGVTLSGSLVAGDTIAYADVPGSLASVVAYDAAGQVVEDHPLKPCHDPVSCEVR